MNLFKQKFSKEKSSVIDALDHHIYTTDCSSNRTKVRRFTNLGNDFSKAFG